MLIDTCFYTGEPPYSRREYKFPAIELIETLRRKIERVQSMRSFGERASQ